MRLTCVNRMRLVACDWRPCFPPHMYAFIPRRRPVARISQGGILFGGKVDLTPKGGSHLVKKWTFVLYPMEPLAQGGGVFRPPRPPPPLATGLRRESISRRTAEMEIPGDQEMLVTIGIAYYYMKRVKKKEPTNMGPSYKFKKERTSNFLPSIV